MSVQEINDVVVVKNIKKVVDESESLAQCCESLVIALKLKTREIQFEL